MIAKPICLGFAGTETKRQLNLNLPIMFSQTDTLHKESEEFGEQILTKAVKAGRDRKSVV